MVIKTVIVCDVCETTITNTDTTLTVELKSPNQQPVVGRIEMCDKCYAKAKANLEKAPKPSGFVSSSIFTVFK